MVQWSKMGKDGGGKRWRRGKDGGGEKTEAGKDGGGDEKREEIGFL
jgi:hypothetical protein